MTLDEAQKLIEQLQSELSESKAMNKQLMATIQTLNNTIANLQETIDELNRKFFGRSSERSKVIAEGSKDPEPVVVKEHVRKRGVKSKREDLYRQIPVRPIHCDVPEEERFCSDCGAKMEHLGYKTIREELRITPAVVERVVYMQETLVCPACREEGDTTIMGAETPTPLFPHSPASPDMVATIMYQKNFMQVPFYRQEQDWLQKGLPLPRGTAARWFNDCGNEYLYPIYDLLHQDMVKRDLLHGDEVPCQCLHEEGKEATSKSYMWVYRTAEKDGKPVIILYDYQPGRSGDYPIQFLAGFTGLFMCDGYSAYGRIADVILVCCLAHCRRKFFEAVPKARQKNLKLLDINSVIELDEESCKIREDGSMLPSEIGVAYCNKLFFLERQYKNLPAEERKARRLETEPTIWEAFWNWIATVNPTGGSKLEKAVNYALNHRETLMNYLQDGRCDISNNAAERACKSYVMGRKNFLFHDQPEGARASAIVLSLIETAKANNLNIYKYLYTLLLYMPDYKTEPAGIAQLLPWTDFIKARCSEGSTIDELPETRGKLSF